MTGAAAFGDKAEDAWTAPGQPEDPEEPPPARAHRFATLRPGAPECGSVERQVAVEAPVALEFDGITLAVMMATPRDLGDFVTGFAIAERLLSPRGAPRSIDVHAVADGFIVRAALPEGARSAVYARARSRVAESSCGLCGIESLAEVARPIPAIERPLALGEQEVFAALAALHGHQPLAMRTGAVHAAALCRPDGAVLLAREDVGRHNALDKAIGAGARAGVSDPVFALSTARCSYELVEKAAVAGIGALVTISAPTTFAVERAATAGLPLYVLARADRVLRAA